MSIHIDETKRIFTLQTANTAYQLYADPAGVLIHTYYGKAIPAADMSYLLRRYDRGFAGNPYEKRNERDYSLDTLPQEYPSHGVGDYRGSGLRLRLPGGSTASDFRYAGYSVLPGKYALPGLPASYAPEAEADTLRIDLTDAVTGLTVHLLYGVLSGMDVITRAVTIENTGKSPVTLEKAASACVELPPGTYDLLHFQGRHCMERLPDRHPLAYGSFSVSSTRGMSSHQHNPFVILCDHDATEDTGSAYGLMLMYSGNHETTVEMDQLRQVRMILGIHEEGFLWTLSPGEAFTAPEAVLSYSGEGLGTLSRNLHRFLQDHVCRSLWKKKRRPVLLNSWEAMYFQCDEEKVLSLAKKAASLGIELFVLDDGWFQNRCDDNAGLGDWDVDTEKFPEGLSGLSEKIHALGLSFGLWMEPEMVSEAAALYRQHPDWAITVPGRKPMMGRNQLVLDLSNPAVQAYVYTKVSGILSSARIEYIKWDFNRCISDVFSNAAPAERQGELLHRYYLGLYAILERLTREFPEVLFESCAGGGGRFDAGMLYYTPQIWCSDDTDAIERIYIHYGTSFGYPAAVTGAHVSASPNHQTGRHTSLMTRTVSAMGGTFGYELDLNRLSEEELSEISSHVALYKTYGELIQNGLQYRLSPVDEKARFAAWQYVSEDRKKSLVCLVLIHHSANDIPVHIFLRGLSPDALYRVTLLSSDMALRGSANGSIVAGTAKETLTLPGAALLYGGYTFPLLLGDYPAALLSLEQEE